MSKYAIAISKWLIMARLYLYRHHRRSELLDMLKGYGIVGVGLKRYKVKRLRAIVYGYIRHRYTHLIDRA